MLYYARETQERCDGMLTLLSKLRAGHKLPHELTSLIDNAIYGCERNGAKSRRHGHDTLSSPLTAPSDPPLTAASHPSAPRRWSTSVRRCSDTSSI